MKWTKEYISILAIVAITSFMGTFLISSVNIALPAIETEFGLNAVSLSWLVTGFLLASAILLLPVGRLADSKGIRRLFRIGLLVFTLTSLLCGFAPNGLMLIFFRFLQGTGAALTTTTGPAILVSAFPPKQRGRVLGISVSGVYLGLATGPLFGGFLTQAFGWRSIFFLSALMGLGSIILAFLFLGRDGVLGDRQPIKLKGLLLYMPGLFLMVFGSSWIPSLTGWGMIALGVIFLFAFWFHERRSTAPIFDTRLFSENRLFTFSNLAALINYSATYAIVFFLSLYLQKIQLLSPREAGSVLIAQPAMMALFSPVAGRLSDRIQPRYLATLGMSMCTLGLAAFAFLGPETSLEIIVGILIFVGLGFAFFSSPNMNTIMGSVNRQQYGIASGTSATMRVLGQMASMTIVTIFFALLFEKQSVAAVNDTLFLKAQFWGFLTFAAIGATGIYFSFNRGKLARE
ncbi:MAG: MFS transporter [Bacteroidales bacterium]|jgi:EmrB/QacA subfamily drug resistance transporter|nr:MFS transporter [Bacteroidales bacterium]NLM91389.1 MFS transporter [Bacteroidales bacterium]